MIVKYIVRTGEHSFTLASMKPIDPMVSVLATVSGSTTEEVKSRAREEADRLHLSHVHNVHCEKAAHCNLV